MAVLKDKEVILFNPITGNFDLALKFNENRIVMHAYNSAGNPLVTYDVPSGQYIPGEYLTVTDNNGNVVVV